MITGLRSICAAHDTVPLRRGPLSFREPIGHLSVSKGRDSSFYGHSYRGMIPSPANERRTEGETALPQAATGTMADICHEHAPLLRALARRKFQVPDEDVDDLVQDVFATYLTCPAPVNNLRGYLVGGICNASREYWRRQKRNQRLFSECDDDPPIPDDDVIETVMLAITLNKALGHVDERCRRAMTRRYVDDEDTASIAESMGTTRSNINYILHVCRKRLRAILRRIA